MTDKTVSKPGRDLVVGDTIKVWWKPGRDTITELRIYQGPLLSVFPDGARIANFALNTAGMTIDNAALYEVVVP